MAKLALYQKYRSSTFEEVVGQEYIVRSIKNAVRENKVGHAYLFCGPRGTGKTTMARLLAKAVNCEHPEKAPCGECANCIAANNGTHPDIIEINAANETHVEDIRDLIDRSTLAPMQGKHKVYIIDEVHQLSSAASSALLKTLEEPPENVIFILATTDPQKLLSTIISRCQRYDFTKVKKEQIKGHLLHIAKEENIEMEEDAADMIASLADGGVRDSLSIMDQCASYTNDHITVDDIDRIYGLTTVEEKVDLMEDIASKNMESMIKRIQSYEERGIDLARFTDGMIDICKDCVVYQTTKKPELMKVLPEEQAQKISGWLNMDACMSMAEKLIDDKQRFKTASNAATAFEVTCLSLLTFQGFAQAEVQPKKAPVSKPVVKHASMVHEQTENIPEPDDGPEPIEETVQAPVPNETEAPAEESSPAGPINAPVSWNSEQIISLLVQCDKQSKASDENTMAMLKSYGDLKNRKYTSLLEGSIVGASGPDCMILIAKQQAIANRINEEQMNKDLYFFMKDVMHTDKMLYAIMEDDFKKASMQYRDEMIAGTLPSPMKIEKYHTDTVKEKTSEEKVNELFGSDNVEVI